MDHALIISFVSKMKKNSLDVTNQLSSECAVVGWQRTLSEAPLGGHWGGRGSLPLHSDNKRDQDVWEKGRDTHTHTHRKSLGVLFVAPPVVWTMYTGCEELRWLLHWRLLWGSHCLKTVSSMLPEIPNSCTHTMTVFVINRSQQQKKCFKMTL